MLHHAATTCLVLPNGLSRTIKVIFSFCHVDQLAINLYILQYEPFLRILGASLNGLVINNFRLIDNSYCDDDQTMSSDVNDLIKKGRSSRIFHFKQN